MSDQSTPPAFDVLDMDSLANEVSEGRVRTSYTRIALITLFFTCCILLIHFSPLREFLAEVQNLKDIVAQQGYFAVFVFAGFTMILTFFGAPKLVFYTLGGLLFGFWIGFLVAQISALLGAYGPFMFSRWVAGDWVMSKLDSYQHIKNRLEQPTVIDVFLCRQLPIWGAMVSIVLGTTKVTHGRFLMGSFIGFLPQGIIFTLIGDGFAEETILQAIARLWAAIFTVLIAGLLTLKVIKNKR